MNATLKAGALLLIGFGMVTLSGCLGWFAKVDEVIDKGTELYCKDPVSRATTKAILDPSFRAKDQAACIRCPGEENLSCAGDPKGLPASQ